MAMKDLAVLTRKKLVSWAIVRHWKLLKARDTAVDADINLGDALLYQGNRYR